MHHQLRAIRETRPTTADHLWHWLYAYTGVRLARSKVCRNHQPPLDWLADQWLNRPDQILILGSRGSGKSFNEALLTHLESRFNPHLGTRILGGAWSQSMQIFEALSSAILDGRGPGGSDSECVRRLLTDKAVYRNGSKVAILAASPTSVRGPHVATLRLDEVDEIKPDLREAALGMCMAVRGVSASVSLTSTWHRTGGPMTELVERGRAGEIPLYTTCTFDVLERCDSNRSGRWVGGVAGYERCPACPIKPWCHAERDRNGDVPLAKLSDGHYTIDSLIQKARAVSPRTFGADYLCNGPRPDGLWFTQFNESLNVDEGADYDRSLKVHLSIDSGVFTGAVFFQTKAHPAGDILVNVFAELLTENAAAESVATQLLELARARCLGRLDRVSTDAAGGSRNPVGPTVIEEYRRKGLRGQRDIDCWPVGSVADSLALLEGLIGSAEGSVWLRIHPRCRHLIAALKNYRRAKRGGQWQDYPEDPQHPHEDLVDALRGGLKVEMPAGRKAPSTLARRSIASISH